MISRAVFSRAIRYGPLSKAFELLESDATVAHEKDEDLVTPLHWAALVRFIHIQALSAYSYTVLISF